MSGQLIKLHLAWSHYEYRNACSDPPRALVLVLLLSRADLRDNGWQRVPGLIRVRFMRYANTLDDSTANF